MIGFIILILILAVAAICCWLFFFRFVTSEPNEWMLVLRNGNILRAGIGISQYVYWGDKVVKFPSKLNKVNFAAQQVTKEMQGVEVKGVIIWSIFREGEGPYKAYRSLGDDLRNEEPKVANENLREMSNAIVRHRIANSCVSDIMTKRDSVRNEIKSELNKLVNGWGVWLETVEITDVHIMSNTLFTNLQTPYREELRIKAEVIRMNTDQDINNQRIESSVKTAQIEADNQSEKDIFKATQNLKVSQENQKVFEKDQELKKKKIASEFDVKSHTARLEEKYKEIQKEQTHQEQKENVDRQIELEKKAQAQIAAEEETKAKKLKLKLGRQIFEADHKRETERLWLEMENKLNSLADFRFHALQACEDIYKKLPIKEVKVFNYGQNDKESGVLAKLFSGFNAIKEEVK